MALLLERHAFRTDGFDPAALVTQLKQLFPTDHAGWKATVGTAQAGESSGHHRKITAAFPLLADDSNHTGGPTVALHPKPRREATTRPEIAWGAGELRSPRTIAGGSGPFEGPESIGRMFPTELPSSVDLFEHTSLPRLTGWGDAQPDPGSEGGDPLSGPGDDAAAYAALRRWAATRTRRSRWMWLLGGAIAAAAVFAGVHWRKSVPITPIPIVNVRDEASGATARPIVEPMQSVAASPSAPAAQESSQADAVTTEALEPAAPTALAPVVSPAPPTAAEPPAVTKPAVRRSPPVPARIVKKPARKPAIAQRAPAAPAAKPAPARQPAARPDSRPPQAPLVRPGWRDPFGQ